MAMTPRLVTAAIACALLLGCAAVSSAQDEWMTFPILDAGEPIDEEKWVHAFAPTFLQWVRLEREYRDQLTSIGYDEIEGEVAGVADPQPAPGALIDAVSRRPIERWDAADNWDNLEQFRDLLPAVVYAGIVAISPSHVFISYTYFHPQDWASALNERLLFFFEQRHENDLEGAMLVIERPAAGGTRSPIHAYALHHNLWDDRHACDPRNLPERLRERSRCIPRERLERPVVWIESGGHGGHLVERRATGGLDPNTDRFLKYDAGIGSGGSIVAYPSSRLGDTAWERIDASSGLTLVPIWPLFRAQFRFTDRCQDDPDVHADLRCLDLETRLYGEPARSAALRFRGYGPRGEKAAPRLGLYRALAGEKYKANAAKLPWGQDYERFFDPAMTLVKRESDPGRHEHRPISCQYLAHPYLQAMLDGRLAAGAELFGRARPTSAMLKQCAERRAERNARRR